MKPSTAAIMSGFTAGTVMVELLVAAHLMLGGPGAAARDALAVQERQPVVQTLLDIDRCRLDKAPGGSWSATTLLWEGPTAASVSVPPDNGFGCPINQGET